MVIARLKDALCPMVVVHVRTAADLRDRLILVVVAHIGLITAILIAVVFRRHVATAAPVFVSDTEKVYRPRFLAAVCRPQIRHRGNAVKRHIFHPLGHLLHRSASEIAVDVGLASDLAAKLHELMCSKAVVLHNTTPVCVDHLLSAFLWTDSVLPVILIRKTSARPAQYRNLQLLKSLHNIHAHSVHIRDVRMFPNIDSLIDTPSQMLGKMSVDLRCDRSQLVLLIDDQFCHSSNAPFLLKF